MKKSSALKISIAMLIIFMSIGYLLLLLAYSGPRIVVFIVFLVYIFILYFLIKTVRAFIKEMEKIEKEKGE